MIASSPVFADVCKNWSVVVEKNSKENETHVSGSFETFIHATWELLTAAETTRVQRWQHNPFRTNHDNLKARIFVADNVTSLTSQSRVNVAEWCPYK
jgi:hypothetical protein